MNRFLFFAFLLFAIVTNRALAQTDASIKIVKPADRRNVELGVVAVSVEISGAALSDGYTWQMLIDGVPQGAVRDGTTAEITIPEPTGPHRLKAELYDPQGNVVASHEILVIAAPIAPFVPIFNLAWFAPMMAVFTIAVIGIILLGLRLRPRVSSDTP